MAYSALLGLQTFLGLGIVLGTVAFGLIVVKNSVDCMIARQYLCQASSLMISASLLAFSALDDYSGYLLFVWIYGFFLGGYTYSLKMYVYEKVRARNFNRTWSFVQCIQSVPIMVGVPITGFISEYYGNKSGFFLSSFCTAFGALTLFLIDGTKRSYEDKHKMSGLSPERTYGFAASGTALDHYESSPVPFGGPEARIYLDPLVFAGRPLIPGPTGNESLAQVNFTALKALSAAAAASSNQHHTFSHSTLLSPLGSGRNIIGPCGELYSSANQRSCGPTVFNATNTLTSNGQATSSSVGGATAAAAAAAAAAAVAAASAELTCISEEVFMENLIDDYCQSECINPRSRHEDKYLMLSEIDNTHHLEKCFFNSTTHNNVSTFGKHSEPEPSDQISNGKYQDIHHNKFTLAPYLTTDLDGYNGNYHQCQGSINNKNQRRASLPIITNTISGYLSELDMGQNGQDSSTNDEGLTNKLATMEGDIEGFIGDLLDRKLSTATRGTSENEVNNFCPTRVNNLNNDVGSRWRSASESTGYIGDEGGSDDSDSNHDRLINRCSGCLRFVQHDHQVNGGPDKIDSTESPLIPNHHHNHQQQSQYLNSNNHHNHHKHQQQNQVQSFIQDTGVPTAPIDPTIVNTTVNLTPPKTVSTPLTTSAAVTAITSSSSATGKTACSILLQPETTMSTTTTTSQLTLNNEPTSTTNVITKEHEINDYDANDSSRFNDDLAKE